MNRSFDYSDLRLGIIGGGQLGKIMSQKAKKMGFHVTILDPTPNCPAAQVSDSHIFGDFYDAKKLQQLVTQSDVTTFELENVDLSLLKTLHEQGHTIHPSPYIMELIQNKLEQKKFLKKNGIPIPKFKDIASEDDYISFGFPAVVKTKIGGYDGKGVWIVKSIEDAKKILLDDIFIEEMVDIELELSVIVARNIEGDIGCYPLAEMIFDDRVNICDIVVVPARVEKRVEKEAAEIAVEAIKIVGGVGIFAVELFLTKNGKILVNEIAPRPHNSGHFTVEACITSQFDQVIRAVTNLPLGSTKLLSPAVMVNILGEKGYRGKPIIEGICQALKIPELSFHFYGKSETRPFRKMGHFTVLDNSLEGALKKAMKAKELLKVKGEKKYEQC